MSSIAEAIVDIFFLVIFFLLSTPLHEIGHWVILKLLGCRTPLSIKLIQFNLKEIGYVEPRVKQACWYHCPDYLAKHFKMYWFLISFSGGFGVFVVYLLLGALSNRYVPILTVPFFLNGFVGLLDACLETHDNMKKRGVRLMRRMGFYFITAP